MRDRPLGTGVPTSGAHVVLSELAVAEEGGAALEAAFQGRLGEADAFPGFIRLEVWKDEARPGRYLMISWWTNPDAFRAYLRSDQHRRSHARIPTEPARPRGVRVERFSLLST